ncbi:MAG: hypothetical protein JST80_10515 [Bdellovibrionales bacterium]|nr:hypothetical protein [Bdellovibrionales bacterium]
MEFRQLIGLLSLLASLTVHAGNIDYCIKSYTNQMELLDSSEQILRAIEESESSTLHELGLHLRQGLHFAESEVSQKYRSTYEWELGSAFVNARDLVKLQRTGASERELEEFLNLFRTDIYKNMEAYRQKPVAAFDNDDPRMPAATFYRIDGLETSQMPIFTACKLEGFQRWLGGLGKTEVLAVNHRLRVIAERAHLGTTRSVTTGKSVGLHEIKIDVGPGLRIYYIQRNNSFVIMFYGDKGSQDSDIRKAVINASAFLAMQSQ